MSVSFSFLILGIILAAVATLATLVLAIIFVSTGRERSALMLGAGFILSLILLVFATAEVAQRGSKKMKKGIEWLKKMDDKLSRHEPAEENYYGYVPYWQGDSIPVGFYERCDTDADCITLVYPYRFIPENKFLNSAMLDNYANAGDSCAKEIFFVTHFAFDQFFLLAKRDNREMQDATGKGKDLPDYSYFLLDFKTGKCELLMNEHRLFEETESRGYTGERYLSSVSTHYWRFVGSD